MRVYELLSLDLVCSLNKGLFIFKFIIVINSFLIFLEMGCDFLVLILLLIYCKIVLDKFILKFALCVLSLEVLMLFIKFKVFLL